MATQRIAHKVNELIDAAEAHGYVVFTDMDASAPWTFQVWAPELDRCYTLTLTPHGTLSYAYYQVKGDTRPRMTYTSMQRLREQMNVHFRAMAERGQG